MTDMNDVQLLHSIYAKFAFTRDSHAHDEWVSLFTDDAVFDIDGGIFRGREALIEFSKALEADLSGGGIKIKHCMASVDVVVDGDEARGRGDFQFYTIKGGVPTLGALGTYTDRFRRVGGQWKIAERVGRNDTDLNLV